MSLQPVHVNLTKTLVGLCYGRGDQKLGDVEMADISKYPGIRHLRSRPTAYLQHIRHGRIVRDGTGLSFWFRPLTAVLSEVPVDDRELPLLFHARTSDFQDLAVQATLVYRIEDPGRAAARLDFSIDSLTGRWRATPLEQIANMLTEGAQQQALGLLANMTLAAALTDAVASVREQIETGLASDPRLGETGLSVIGVRVVAVRPEPDVQRALQTPTREAVQQEADRATFERRAQAVESERAISENEMESQIELARREEQLVTQRGTNARREAEEAAAASLISTETEASKVQRLAEAKAQGIRVIGESEGAAETARLAAYRDVQDGVLLGLALRDLATNVPKVSSLIVTPDLLAPVLARLARQSAAAGAGPSGESAGQATARRS
jgi:regulator of protease activity HflC (stomatin/prohibitin superfamily)